MREADFAEKLASLTPAQRELLERRRRGLTSANKSHPGIPARPSEVPAPASFAQRQLWFVHQLDPASTAYHIYDYWRLSGELDIEVLEKTLAQLVRRHYCFRTTLKLDAKGVLNQNELSAGAVQVERIDLRANSQPEIELNRLVRREVGIPFDLSSGPLARFKIIILGDSDHALLMTVHHAVYDEWSRKLFWDEFNAVYADLARGREALIDSCPANYADYAYWQRKNADELSAGLEYWRHQLHAVDVLDLPLDRSRPVTPTFAGALAKVRLSTDVSKAVRGIANKTGTTLFMLTLAVFALFLSKHTGQRRMAIGIPLANRSSLNMQNVVGLFLNPMPIVVDIQPAATFHQLLQQIKQKVLNAQSHENIPFELLVEALKPARSLGVNPLFQVMCVQRQPVDKFLHLSGVSVAPIPIIRNDSKFDLTLFSTSDDDGLLIELEYNTDLFYKETADAFARRLAVAVEQIPDSIGSPVSRLIFLTDQDRFFLQQFGKGKSQALEDETLPHRRFESFARRRPDAICLEQAEQTWTYGEIDKRASLLAARLVELGVGTGVLVPIIAGRNHHTVTAIIAVLKAGGAYVPLDPDTSVERLRSMLDQVRSTWPDSVQPSLLSSSEWGYGAALDIHNIKLSDRDNSGSEQHGCVVTIDSNVQASDPAYVVFTSGSSGRPKGVVVSHGNLLHSTAARLSYYPGSVEAFLLLSPFWFDSSIAGLFWTVCDGGRLILPPHQIERHLDRLADCVKRHAVSHTLCLPSVYYYLLKFASPGQLNSLKCVIVAGEACDIRIPALHQSVVGQASLYNEYGPTEATVWSTVCDLSETTLAVRVPIGLPIPRSTIYILDERRQVAPPGAVGEIYIGGAGVAMRYLNDDALTQEHFVPDPFNSGSGERLYKTGDLARFASDGSILLLGRKDNQVKVRGHRVELEDIENTIRSFPEVDDVVVHYRAAKWQTVQAFQSVSSSGDEQTGTLVAWVVPQPGRNAQMSEIKQRARHSLPEYMAPSRFFEVDALPHLANGKVDRAALPLALPEKSERQHSVDEPLDSTQAAICEMWKKMLNLSELNIDSDFFELGGHSLMAAQLVSEIEQKLGHKVSIADVFEQPTIRGLSEQISNSRERIHWCSIVPINESGNKSPFFCVYGNPRQMALHLDPQRPFYWLHHGRDGLLMPYDKIERMAQDHLQQVIAVQQEGSYCLGGFSVGGLVAFEMARQLKRQGKHVSLLALFDPTSPAHDQTRWQARLVTTLRSDTSAFNKVGYVARRIVKLPIILTANLGSAANDMSSRVKRWCHILVNKPMPKKLRKSHRLRVLTRAADQYTYPTYDGAVVLFLPEGGPEDAQKTQALRRAWAPLVGNHLETHIIEGAKEHLELMREPYVTALAQHLNSALDRAG